MPQLRETAVTLLKSQVVNMQTVATVALYNVPANFTLYVHHIIVRNPTATLAGGTDYDFGDVTNLNYFKSAVSLATLTSIDDYIIISANNTVLKEVPSGENFDIDVKTGSTGAANATIEIFGYLV
jgi:hypothetical protein